MRILLWTAFGLSSICFGLYLSSSDAEARVLTGLELTAVTGGQSECNSNCSNANDGQSFNDRKCQATQTCTQKNFNPFFCIGKPDGTQCCKCSVDGVLDHTCVTNVGTTCQIGGISPGHTDCGDIIVGTCSGGVACVGGGSGSVECPCDARKCIQQ